MFYYLVQNNVVVDKYSSSEGAHCVKTNAQVVIASDKKVRIGAKASKLRK